MRIVIMFEGQEGITWDQWRAIAEVAERYPFDALFRSDHYHSVYRGQPSCLDAWTTLAALATITRRSRLGTLVSPVTFRHPTVFAKTAATVDQISGGRVEAGLGAAWLEREHAAYGFPFPDIHARVGMLEEQLELANALWSGEPVTFEGQHYTLKEGRLLPRPVQRPRPPLIVGGLARRRTVSAAIRWADEYNTYAADLEECRKRSAFIVSECEAASRDPATLPVSLASLCIIGTSEADVSRRVVAAAERCGRQRRPGETVTPASVNSAAELLRERLALVGTPQKIAEQLHLHEEAGIDRIYLTFLCHEDLEQVEILGEEVLPIFAKDGRVATL
jgi:F420-dependent oxidoreductase-like protein